MRETARLRDPPARTGYPPAARARSPRSGDRPGGTRSRAPHRRARPVERRRTPPYRGARSTDRGSRARRRAPAVFRPARRPVRGRHSPGPRGARARIDGPRTLASSARTTNAASGPGRRPGRRTKCSRDRGVLASQRSNGLSGRRGEPVRGRRRPGARCRAPRPGASALRSWPSLRATRRRRGEVRAARPSRHSGATPSRSRRSAGRSATCCPRPTSSSVTTPSRCATIGFSIFIASTTQISAPASTASPSATLDFEHGALHRARRPRPTASPREPLAPLLVTASKLRPGGLGCVHADLVASPVELDCEDTRARASAEQPSDAVATLVVT